jgi:hypothetical protein
MLLKSQTARAEVGERCELVALALWKLCLSRVWPGRYLSDGGVRRCVREREEVGGSRVRNEEGGSQADCLVSREGAAERQAGDGWRSNIGAAEMQRTMSHAWKLVPMGVPLGRAVPVGGCWLRIRCSRRTTRHRAECKRAHREAGGKDGGEY